MGWGGVDRRGREEKKETMRKNGRKEEMVFNANVSGHDGDKANVLTLTVGKKEKRRHLRKTRKGKDEKRKEENKKIEK